MASTGAQRMKYGGPLRVLLDAYFDMTLPDNGGEEVARHLLA